MSLRERKIEVYVKSIPVYGVIALKLMVSRYEDDQNFEECAIIRDAIIRFCERINSPHEYDCKVTSEEAFEYFERFGILSALNLAKSCCQIEDEIEKLT